MSANQGRVEMLKIQYAIQKVADCCDGNPFIRYRVMVNWSANRPDWGVGKDEHWQERKLAQAYIDKMMAELAASENVHNVEMVQVEDMETRYVHSHIGEYGSPRRFRCSALDGVK